MATKQNKNKLQFYSKIKVWPLKLSYNHGGHNRKWHLQLCHFFVTIGKYHKAIWTNNHVVMASHICGLRL